MLLNFYELSWIVSLLFIIEIDKGVDVINLVVGSAEFDGQGGGGRSQGFLGQNRLHLSLDRSLLRLQLSYSLGRFLEGKSHGVTDHNKTDGVGHAKDNLGNK